MDQTLLAKLSVIILGCVLVTLLMITNSIDGEAGLPILTAFVGYVTGNGVLIAKQRQTTDKEPSDA